MVSWLPEVLIALISALGGVASAMLPGILRKRKLEEEEGGGEIRNVLSLELRKFSILRDAVDEMFKRTKADRFLIMFAFNGKDHMRFASAIYEQNKEGKAHLSVGAISKYVHVDIDDDYRGILKKAEIDGTVTYEVGRMKAGLLRDILESEGVRYVKLAHIKRFEDFAGEGKDLLVYCSVATHVDEPYTKAESTYIRGFSSMLRNEVFEAYKTED